MTAAIPAKSTREQKQNTPAFLSVSSVTVDIMWDMATAKFSPPFLKLSDPKQAQSI